MSTLRDFFSTEAEDCLRRIESVIVAPAGTDVDGAELLRVTRLLRGSAQMAGDARVLRLARAFEASARALVSHVITWDASLRDAAQATVDDLRALVRATDPEDALDARLALALERLRLPGQDELGDASASGAHVQREAAAREGTVSPQGPAGPEEAAPPPSPPPPEARPPAPDPFLAGAAREVSGIVATLDAELPILRREPLDREPLKRILRRQRALFSSRRLTDLPPVAAALHAIDEVCRMVARRNVAVGGDWLAFFETARRVLAEAESILVDGATPEGADALQELERVRARLVEGADATPVEDFFYRGEALVRRVEELRPAIERAIGRDATAREALDEIHDLIRQVLS